MFKSKRNLFRGFIYRVLPNPFTIWRFSNIISNIIDPILGSGLEADRDGGAELTAWTTGPEPD